MIEVPLARPWFTDEEAEAARSVVASEWLIAGPKVEEFENRFASQIGVKHAIAVNSGSSALLVVQQALGITRGDEVIVPNMTFISTATSAMYLGATPVFADITLDSYCIDPADIERRITPNTKLIIPVHYAGQSADMSAIQEIADHHNLPILEDAAEAHLAEFDGRKVGSIGEAAIFSFTPSKPMTTGEGGMITTDNDDLAEKCRAIRNFADKGKFEWVSLGFNFRMPEVMGAIGLVQLTKLQEAIERRRSIAAAYNAAFNNVPEIITPWARTERDINYQLYTIRIDQKAAKIPRNELIAKLSERGVASRLYYPALHDQDVFSALNTASDYPKTAAYAASALSLPIYPQLTESEIYHVTASITELVQGN